MAQWKNKEPNYSLWDHCKAKEADKKYGNLENDGYVSTTTDIAFSIKWVIEKLDPDNDPPLSTIYKIASDKNLIGCIETLKDGQYTNPLEFRVAKMVCLLLQIQKIL